MQINDGLGRELNKAICDALDIDESRVLRIIIVSEYNELVQVKIDMAPKDMTALDWRTLLSKSQVTVDDHDVQMVMELYEIARRGKDRGSSDANGN